MEASKQKQVFDWLLAHRAILDGSDNSILYKTFCNSGLTRNRLRSYKSRLRDKVGNGEVDAKDPEETIKPIPSIYWYGLSALLLGILTVVGYCVLRRSVRWVNSLLAPAAEEEK